MSPTDATAPFSWVRRGRCYRLGHDVPHMGGVVPMRVVSEMRFDPKDIVPYLFSETDPGFHERCRPGDVIVTGRNFGMGPKMQGYIAMQALGLGLVCESMPFLAYREAIGLGLPVLTDCPGVSDACATNDDVEVDFLTGRFINHTRGAERAVPAVPEGLREIVAMGGTNNWLKRWWLQQDTAGSV
jgi:3-isopropylmalate/(R)-2-methylmalate dehydratase small subunit